MKRRRLLAGIGGSAFVAASGCLGGVFGGSGSNRNGTDGSTPMTLSLISVDSAPGPLSFEVTVSSDRLSATAIPILDIAVENAGDETVSWSYAGQVSDLPLPQGIHDSRTDGLVIGLREEVQAQLIDAADGCSRVEQFVRADGVKNTVLESGERIERSYAVAAVDGNLEGTCPEPGDYRMEHDLGGQEVWGFEFQLA